LSRSADARDVRKKVLIFNGLVLVRPQAATCARRKVSPG
jgi:hypothetical protein